MKNYIIYALKEKNKTELKYIGLTTGKLDDRFKRHLRDNKIVHKTNWIKQIGKNNIEIIIIEDKIQDFNILCQKEIFYINYYKELGHKLTNISNGGEGWTVGTKFTDKHKENISKYHADVSGENNPMYGKTHTQSAKQKNSVARKGSVHTNETKEKMSNKNKGENNNNSKLTITDVIEIRKMYNDKKFTQQELAIKYNVNQPAIYKIIKFITWKHI